MRKQRKGRQRPAQGKHEAPVTVPVSPPEHWWKRVQREALLIGGGFLGAVGFAGAFKLDEWLASWAAQPVALFRAVAHTLFFWVPSLGIPLRESLTLSCIIVGVFARGIFVENTTFANRWYRERQPTKRKQWIKRILLFDVLICFPLALGFVVELLSGRDWEIADSTVLLAFTLFPIVFIILTLFVIGAKAAPRSTTYLLGFLLLFYSWGLVVDGGLATMLPTP